MKQRLGNLEKFCAKFILKQKFDVLYVLCSEKMAFTVSHIFVSDILSIMLLNQSFYTFCDSDPDQASNYQ